MKFHHGAVTRRTIMILLVSGVAVTGLTLTGRARSSRLFSSTTNYGDYMEKRAPIPHRRKIPQAPPSIYQTPPNKKGVVKSSLGILKKGVFVTFDVVSSIVSKINEKKSEDKMYIESGYGDMVENASAGMVFSSEEMKLKRQYEALEREKIVLASSTPSSFDDAKTGFYSTIDGVGKLLSPTKDASNSLKSTSIVASSPSQNDPYKLEMQRLMPQRNDPNPLTRLSAEYRLQSLQIAKTRDDARRRREEAVTLAKTAVYGTLDALTSTARFLSTATTRTRAVAADVRRNARSLPEDVNDARRMLETVAADVKSIPTVVSAAVDDVASFPTAVETSLNGVLRRSVDDVRRSVDATVTTMNDVPRIADAIAWNAKIAAGLERRPVRPPTTKDEGNALAWNIAKMTCRIAWDASRGTAMLGYRGAKWGVGKAWMALQMRRGVEGAERATEAKDVALRRITNRQKRIQTVADVDADLGREVAEALRGAEAVLGESETKAVYLDDFGEDYEMKESIDEALKIAKITAKKVKEDSEFVERAYNQTKM